MFWGRNFPGFRGKPQVEREHLTKHYTDTRPDLYAQLEQERVVSAKLAALLRAGPYTLGSGDTELSRAFTWRFWHLIRQGGRMGAVVPRQQVLAAPGMKQWRQEVLDQGRFDDIALLTNSREWVFPNVHMQYTVGLVSIRKGGEQGGLILHGPYRSMAHYQLGMTKKPEEIESEEFAKWNEDLILPTLADVTDVGIYRQLMKHPKMGSNRSDFSFRPVAEFHASGDKHLFEFATEAPEGYWPVYGGMGLDLWTPDTGERYAFIDPTVAVGHLFNKRKRQARTSTSAFYGLDDTTVNDKNTLAVNAPRLVYRQVTNRTNTRTVLTALIPPHVVVQHGAPYLHKVNATPADEAYVLGVLSSRILDWAARRTVELNLTFALFDSLPVPAPKDNHPGRQRIIQLAGRLAAVDERYADWAAEVGVDYGPVPEGEAEGMKAELDACVARLYGLEEQEIRDLYATFHPTWDHEPWTEAVLEHYRKITWDPAEVPA